MVIVNKTTAKNKYDALEGAGAKYEVYLKYELAYRKLVNTYHNIFAEMQSDPERSMHWPETHRLYSEEISALLEHWETFGYKKEIELAFLAHKCLPLRLNHLIPVRAIAV